MASVRNLGFFVKQCTLEIEVTGGVINSLELLQLCDIADYFEVKYFHLGQRQDFYMTFPADYLDAIQIELKKYGFHSHLKNIASKNIITSLPAVDVFGKSQWVSEGILLDIISLFDYQPTVTISIVDAQQSLVSLFGSQLNFVSSGILNYWYLYLRPDETGSLQKWPELIYSTEIARVTQSIAKNWQKDHTLNISSLLKQLKNEISYVCLPSDDDLVAPRYRFSYYEGMNRYENKFWLGMYRRKERIATAAIRKIAKLLQITNAGNLYLTPWKSLLIKNIKEEDRIKWEMFLGENGFNLRHSCTDLIWKLPDINREMYMLKKRIVASLDKKDVRTYGLTFGLKNSKDIIDSATILIEQEFWTKFVFLNHLFANYTISYKEDFNPNSQKEIRYQQRIPAHHVPSILKDLCSLYYSKLNKTKPEVDLGLSNTGNESPLKEIHECKDCGTIYDPQYGDSFNRIPAGLTFDQLPQFYECPVCGAGKESFLPKKMSLEKIDA
jgi:rubredoxin